MKYTNYSWLWLALIAMMSLKGFAQQKQSEFKGQFFQSLRSDFDAGDFSLYSSNKINGRTDGSLFLSKVIKVPLENITPFLSFSVAWQGNNLNTELLDVELRYSVTTEDTWTEWAPFAFNEHLEQSKKKLVSVLRELPKQVSHVQVRVLIKEVENTQATPKVERVFFNFFSPGDSPESTKEAQRKSRRQQRTSAACDQPAYVTRSQWGAIPRSAAATSTVTHLIIHHEAGSNTSSDWAARVRSVQSYHINTNGWSDIGYNFLIDPNGVVYEGRAGGDNAIGAHFCGSNGNTMAICMLGTFTSVTPTAGAQGKLVELLSWKSNKEGIDPLGSSFKSGVGTISNISGHRAAGCSVCPGDALDDILPDIRSRVDEGCNLVDTTPPTTSMTAQGGSVQYGDFTVDFSDSDDVGVTRQYYQVLEWVTNEWRGNRENGFFNDNFQDGSMHPDYTYHGGSWAESSNHLLQSDGINSNTGLTSVVNQNSGLPYMYQFSAKVSSSGNQKMGLHIVASDPNASQRGNSYLIWFNGVSKLLYVYETVDNILYERINVPISFDNDWADYKITYSPAYGVIQVWRNNEYLLNWTDSSPISSGNYISLRTNGTTVEFDDLKVYRYRLTSAVTVTAGPEASNDARTASTDGISPSCKVKSMVRDDAANWSAPGNLDVVLQWTTQFTSMSNIHRLAVSPNPTSQDDLQLRYEMPQSGHVSVNLYDARGTFISTLIDTDQVAGRHVTEFRLSDYDLRKGLYFLKLTSKGDTDESVKFIVR